MSFDGTRIDDRSRYPLIVLTIDDAIRLAQRFALQESVRTGKPMRGLVEELEHGWAIWTASPGGELAPHGQGNKTVLDRERGQLSHWPAWSTATLAREYAAQRSTVAWRHYQTLDLSSPRQIKLFDAVTSAALLGPDGRRWIQTSALLDDLPEHHPLLTQWLAGQPPESLVLGAERHAILWVLSEVLHTVGSDTGSDTLHSFRIDPARLPCATCVAALVHFGVSSPHSLAFHSPRGGDLVPGPQTFPDGSRFDPAVWAEIAFEILEEPDENGHRIPRMHGARQVIERRPLVTSDRCGPGTACWVSPFRVAITPVLRSGVPVLRAFSDLVDAALYPLGVHEPHGIIAVDERGRLFVLNEGGAFYCGQDIDDALNMLLEGVRLPRVREDGGLDA